MSANKDRIISKRAIPGYTLIAKEGHYQLKKISFSGARFKTDPAFFNARRLNKEFGYASKLVKLIRSVLLQGTNVKSPTGPLTKALMNLIAADEHNILGRRSPLNGPLAQLEGFNFNPACSLQSTVNSEVRVSVNEHDRTIAIDFPAGKAGEAVNAPAGATHYTMQAIIASFNLNTLTGQATTYKTGYLPVKQVRTNGKQIIHKIKETEEQLHMVVVSVSWHTVHATTKKMLKCKHPAPLAIVRAWRARV
jgi:hypothetical protein